MPDGFFGRLLLVDLSRGIIKEESLPASMYSDYLGGYGLGVRLLYDRLAADADPLGPDNLLGFFPGLLTGTGIPFSGRFMVVGKSPLTGGWGESNCGGHFGPVLRSAGLDGLLVTGSSRDPVYLHIAQERAELRDAAHLWGLGTLETDQQLKARVGKGTRGVCIGPAGEKRSLLAGILPDGMRAAARSGLGAVMGSKRLKAIAVRGSNRLAVHDETALAHLNREHLKIFKREGKVVARLMPRLSTVLLPLLRHFGLGMSGGPADAIIQVYRDYGTCFGIPFSTAMGDAPVRNWKGVADCDFPLARSHSIAGDAVIRHQVRRYHCSSCPVGCSGVVRTDYPEVHEARKPEFETLAAFGPLLLNDDLESILETSRLCYGYGLDPISVGATVAFALECAERGIIGPEHTDGLELAWGDSQSILELVRRIGAREGIGDLLADGTAQAAMRLGAEAEESSMHVGGQELPMYDARYEPMLGLAYVVDPTPARHTVANGGVFNLSSLKQVYATQEFSPGPRYHYEGKGARFALLNRYLQVVNCAGLCLFALLMGQPPVLEWLNATTGWDLDLDGLLLVGHRIQVLRRAFNLRVGSDLREFCLRPRAAGYAPLQEGPLTDVSQGMEIMKREYRQAMGYDESTGLPTETLLDSLGLPQVAEELKGAGR